MDKIRAVVIDDDVVNAELLVCFLEKYCPLIDVVGQAFTKQDAIILINEKQPQLLFLDIVLDIGTGFDVLKEVSNDKIKVIFVTSFDEFAIKAFKYNAVDYLLKPLQIEELIIAVNKAYKDIEKDIFTNEEQINLLIESANNHSKPFDFIAIPSMDKIDFIKIRDILYFQADGRYTTIHLINGKKIVACKNIGEYENLLEENVFFRIHHSYMVNLAQALNINKAAGNYCEMVNGKSLPVSKRRQDKLLKFLKLK